MRFHSNASTNLSQRRSIAASPLSLRAQASFLGVSPTTVHRWSLREEPLDRSSRPKTTRRAFTDELEAAALSLRRKGLTLDELLDALTASFGKVARSTLHAFLVRHGLGRLPKDEPENKAFKDYEPGFLHVDLTYLPRLGGESRYLYVAVDRATRLAFFQVRPTKEAKEATAFLEAALAFFPFRAHRLLTDNGTEFTNRRYRRSPAGARKEHPFEALCRERGISHRLTAPYTPKTNGMVERLNRSLKEGPVKVRHESREAMERAILDWGDFYNEDRKHGGIQRRTPLQEALRWYKEKPGLFLKEPARKSVQALTTYPD